MSMINQKFLSYTIFTALLVFEQANLSIAAPIIPSNVPLANIDVVPSNVLLALSVEFPTGDTSSYLNSSPTYDSGKKYYGYFNPDKCYTYSTTNLYFSPTTCSSTTPKGNFLNWVSMTSLDQFRKILTGGNRKIDEVSTTVLQRSYNDTQSSTSYFPTKTAKITSGDAGNMGSTSSNYTYRSHMLGDKILVQSGDSISIPGNPPNTDLATKSCSQLGSGLSPSTSPACYHVRVKVCTENESGCTKYGFNYKPEGLIQQYHRNMRFAAFGYLIDGLKSTQGGVLRARMKSVGPTITNALSVSLLNSATEWDSDTGIFKTSPDGSDASNSSVPNSGVINYLNKFGYFSTTGVAYKGFDPMAEMYYEAIRYLRGLQPTPQAYPATISPSKLDGFPAINFQGKNTPDDPVTSACQANFVIAIGDVNNHCDRRVPGGSVTGDCGGSVASDTPGTESFADETNQISAWEGGSKSASDSPGRYAGWFMGGIAYWSHIYDIRPDKASRRIPGQIQNIDSYFFDVLEPWNGGSIQDGTIKTPFWTAAKYGGFDLTLTDQSSTTNKNNPNTFKSGSTRKSWDYTGAGADNVPDHWFGGNDPLKMASGLNNVFDKIASAGTVGEGAAPATSGVSLATASKIYYANYTLANGGRGSVKACPFTATNCAANTDWDAAAWLTPGATTPYTYLTNSARQIVTRSDNSGQPFLYSSLAAADKTNLSYDPATQASDPVTSPTLAEKRVNYLRGDSSNEITNGGSFRSRFGTKLGDIVGAGPVYVGAPSALYSGDKFLTYSQFIADNLDRKPVIYAGANDGMLHAFDAANGKELLAYIPGYFLKAATGKNAARISSLTNPVYTHEFFVDATPMVGDVKIGSTWKTLLVGGYGAGGKGFYALDITDPGNLTESNADTLSKWEISDTDDSDIGYTYNQPTSSPISGQSLQYALVPTGSSDEDKRWAIIVGNGFGSATGNAALLFIDPDDGEIFKKITVTVGSTVADNGLATPFPIDTDQDGLVDTIWAGDLNGTMWRVRWDTNACKNDDDACKWVNTELFKAGPTQPITSAPAVSPHCSVIGAYNVVFGTGKHIERPDYITTTQQALYGIRDNLTSTTVVKADLVEQTILTTSAPNSSTGDISRTYSANAVNFEVKKGWYVNLPTTNGERSVSNPVIPADTGIALLGSFTPATACLPITGYINVLSACTGGQVIDRAGVPINGFGGLGAGIPYFSPPISDRSKTIVITSPAERPGFTATGKDRLEIEKLYNRGIRASWRQIR